MKPSPTPAQSIFLLSLFLFIIPVKALSQADSLTVAVDSTMIMARADSTFGKKLKYDIKNMYGGVVYTYSRPLHWKKENFYTAGAFVVGTGLMLLADESASTYFAKQGNGVPQWIHHLGWYMGKPQYNYTATAGIYFMGLITKNEKLRRTGILIISAATAGGLIQTISKSAAGRARPEAGYGNLHFKPFAKDPEYHSFPSGHTILSTTAVYAISKQFSNLWAKAGILSVGLLTPVSRLWDTAHWLSDVGLGIGISIISVEAVDHFLKKEKKYDADKILNPKRTKISWNFKAGTNRIGIVGVF